MFVKSLLRLSAILAVCFQESPQHVSRIPAMRFQVMTAKAYEVPTIKFRSGSPKLTISNLKCICDWFQCCMRQAPPSSSFRIFGKGSSRGFRIKVSTLSARENVGIVKTCLLKKKEKRSRRGLAE